MSWLITLALASFSITYALIGNAANLPDTLVNSSVGVLQSEEPVSYQPLPIKHAAQPVKTGHAQLNLGAKGVYAFDVATGQELYSNQPDELLPVASITKLATAMVIVRGHKLDKVVTIPELPTYNKEEVTMGLQAGQKFTLKSLLAATLIQSANDAADALAIIDSGSTEAFVKKMNTLPAGWGINEVQFTNASGLNDDNKASAKAIGQIATLMLQNKTVSDLVKLQNATINDTSGKLFSLASTNALLPNGRFTGIKTGYTPVAGQCFVGRTAIKGHEVITVVLGSPDRFGESTQLANWIEQNYTWLEI